MQNIDELKQGFELVKIKHFNSEHYKATHVALVKENKVFVGISRCHENDQFDRHLGREIAIGRALFAWKVDSGILPSRVARTGRNGQPTRKEPLIPVQKVFQVHAPEELEILLEKNVFTEPTPTLEPVAPMLGAPEGCCGDC